MRLKIGESLKTATLGPKFTVFFIKKRIIANFLCILNDKTKTYFFIFKG